MNPVKVRNIEIGSGIPKICVPIVGVTKEEIFEAAGNIIGTGADVVEWRADWYEDVFDFVKVERIIEELRNILGEIPLLFTFRTAKEGGDKSITTEIYRELNIKAIDTGCVDVVDVELSAGDELVKEIRKAAHTRDVKVIVSNHDFHKTPKKDEIISCLCKMQELGADIPKIAVMPQNKKDVLTLLVATEEMANDYADCPIITMSMSGMGVISRICGEVFGSALTFASVGRASAPGQMDVEELKKIIGVLHKAL